MTSWIKSFLVHRGTLATVNIYIIMYNSLTTQSWICSQQIKSLFLFHFWTTVHSALIFEQQLYFFTNNFWTIIKWYDLVDGYEPASKQIKVLEQKALAARDTVQSVGTGSCCRDQTVASGTGSSVHASSWAEHHVLGFSLSSFLNGR